MRSQQQWIAAAAVALAGSMTLSACGLISGSSASTYQSGSMSSPSDQPMGSATPSASMMSTSRGGLMEVKDSMSGDILANPHGMTVYWYTADKKGSGVSACTGSCAVEGLVALLRGSEQDRLS